MTGSWSTSKLQDFLVAVRRGVAIVGCKSERTLIYTLGNISFGSGLAQTRGPNGPSGIMHERSDDATDS